MLKMQLFFSLVRGRTCLSISKCTASSGLKLKYNIIQIKYSIWIYRI